MLNKNQKKRICKIIEEAKEIGACIETIKDANLLDPSWHVLLLYESSERLSKWTKALTFLTVVLVILTCILAFLTTKLALN